MKRMTLIFLPGPRPDARGSLAQAYFYLQKYTIIILGAPWRERGWSRELPRSMSYDNQAAGQSLNFIVRP